MDLPPEALRALEGYKPLREIVRPRGTTLIMRRAILDGANSRPSGLVVKIPPKGKLSRAELAHRSAAMHLAADVHARLGHFGAVRMVRCLFYDDASGVEILERVPGRQILRGPWNGLWAINPFVPRKDALQGLFEIGRWLRALHDQTSAKRITQPEETWSSRCVRAIRKNAENVRLRTYFSSNKIDIDSLLEKFTPFSLSEKKIHMSIIHGDFSPHNVLSNDYKIFYVIDYSDMMIGSIWHDVISFLFSLETAKLNPIVRKDASSRCQRAFIDGYDRPIPWEDPTVQMIMLRFYLRRMTTLVSMGTRGERAASAFLHHFGSNPAGGLRLSVGDKQ